MLISDAVKQAMMLRRCNNRVLCTVRDLTLTWNTGHTKLPHQPSIGLGLNIV